MAPVSVPTRMLVLVPREPQLDPRFGWVSRLCGEVARTDVFAAVSPPVAAPLREYDGRIYLERVDLTLHARTRAKALGAALGGLLTLGPIARDVERVNRPADAADGTTRLRRLDRRLGVTGRLAASYGQLRIVMSALLERSLALSIPPAVVVCHDLPTLPVGLAVRRAFGSKVVFDCHDFWPELNPLADEWERALVGFVDRRLARQADAVVTVSPSRARYLEQQYGIDGVVVSPNAEPFRGDVEPAAARPTSLPVRFLMQGIAGPGRGLEALLEAWTRVDAGRAVLYLQSPENQFLADLRARHREAIDQGRIVLLPPAQPDRLIEAATFADVGVIPYHWPSANYRYASPNKLSQYMHAGLAILSHQLDFVSEVIGRYDCGITYDARDPGALVQAVERLVADLPRLDALKRNSFEAVRTEFNWAMQSKAYRELLEELCAR
jgi:glycosyltransferase involved in cell wall biosynthesis